MKAKAMKADAMKAKAMKRPAAGLKAKAPMKAKSTKAKATMKAKAMKRPAAVKEPWAKLKMSRDEYMFWACRGVDPSMVEPGSVFYHAVLPVREPP